MIKHIFLLSLRNLFRQKVYSITIILSLAVGFSVANILVGFNLRELKTDAHHSKKERIFRLVCEDPFGRDGYISFMESSIPEYLRNHYPEIEASSLINTLRYNGISKSGSSEKMYDLTLLMTDKSFLDIFDYPLDQGNQRKAMGPEKILLDHEAAELLFGQFSSLDERIEISVDTSSIPLHVSGILQNTEQNSHLTFDGLVHIDDFRKIRGGVVYLLLRSGTDASELNSKINNDASMPGLLGPGKIKYNLQPLENVYFDVSNNRRFSKVRDKSFITIGWAITLAVLFLAAFNFLNLFFNAFLNRWKEFGMKKILGATITVFRLTAIFEVAVYVMLAFTLSVFITTMLIPWFNPVLGSEMRPDFYSDPHFMGIAVTVIFIISIVVIIRISGFIYRINPVSIFSINSRFRTGYNLYMFGIQFIISMVLLVSSVTIMQQNHFIRNTGLGFNRNIVEVRAPLGSDQSKMEVFRNQVNTIPGIISSSLCSGNPISDNMIARYDLENGEYYTPYIFIGDEYYLETLGLKLLEGKIPSPGNPTGKLINEAFVRHFDFKDPIGEKIPGAGEDYITGVVQDFNIASLNQEIPPVIISVDNNFHTLIARIPLDKLGFIIPEFENFWRETYPEYPFKYLLISDELANKHSADLVFGKIISSAAIISILITCFGLFALAWGTAQGRSREIGIRKVNGASSVDILGMLSKLYLKVILIAALIGIPLSLYLMNNWLEKFAFKVDLGAFPVILSAILMLAVTFLAIGYHTIRSSMQNPADILRYE